MNRKIAFLFSGQGAQYVGMGKELCERFLECEQVFHYATQILGRDMKELCFQSDKEALAITKNTQPALFTVEAAILAVLKKYKVTPDVVAGFSIGEYCALYASGIFDLMSCFYLVGQRANAMERVSEDGKYGMAAISGKNLDQIETYCREYDDVWITNYNSYTQVSIAGKVKSVEEIIAKAKQNHYRAVKLNVSGAFHSPLMKEAAKEFETSTQLVRGKENHIPIVLNVTGEYYNKSDDIKKIMTSQIDSPVQWTKSIELMLQDGVTDFIEIGPGQVLSRLVKNISNDKKVNIMHVEDMKSLSETIDIIYN